MDSGRLSDVLDATYICLTRYGVRRTTMDDIAAAMGVSRSAVYQYVRGKDDAFRQLAGRLHTQALASARLAAKLDLSLHLIGDSPHTAELMDSKARLFGEICTEFTAELRKLLAGLFTEAGAADADAAAEICVALVSGLETAPDGQRLLGRAVGALVPGLLHPAEQVGHVSSTTG